MHECWSLSHFAGCWHNRMRDMCSYLNIYGLIRVFSFCKFQVVFMYVSELVRNLPVCVLVKLYLLYSIYFHCFCWFAIAVIDSEPRFLANSEFSFTPGIRRQQVSCLSSTVTRIWCWSNKFSSVLKPHRQAAYMTLFILTSEARNLCEVICESFMFWHVS